MTVDFKEFDKEIKRRVTVSTLSKKRNLLDEKTYGIYMTEIEEMFELLSGL